MVAIAQIGMHYINMDKKSENKIKKWKRSQKGEREG